MKKYRNVIIVGSKTEFIAISYENMNSPVLYRRFNKFSNMGKNNTDTVNSLSVINKYLSEKKLTKLDKDIHKLFTTTKDPNWNGNEWNRQLPKWIKQNKEYYKKLLEQD